MLGENHYHFRRGIRTISEKNFSLIVKNEIKAKLFENSDIVVFNFEFSLVRDSFDFSDLNESVYSAKENCLEFFPKRLLKVANIANNHFSEHGSIRSAHSISILKNANFIVIGESSTPVCISHNGMNLFFWGVTLIPDKDNTNLYFKSTLENLLEDIQLPPNKGLNDKWIISIHWGNEYHSMPSKEQIALAKELINLGFDFIHGHHPHVIQPVSFYGNGVITYSHGNFIFDQNFSYETRKGLATICEFINTGRPELQFYIVKTRNYTVSNIIEVPIKHLLFNAFILNSKFDKIRPYYFRFLMKWELLINLHKLNGQTLKFLFKKALAALKK